jgi:mannosyltransferase
MGAVVPAAASQLRQRARGSDATQTWGPLGLTQLRHSRAVQAVIALTVLAGALRFATLGVQSIWLDESATMLLVRRSFSGMLSHLASSESAPPLYYILVWVWTKLFGATPDGFRSFSALVGTLTVPVMYLAGKRVSVRVGIWAAALAACSPALYYYSQEARCYGLLIFFSAIAFVLWQRALQQPSGKRLAAWSAVSTLALLTHYFAVFLFIPEAVVLLWRLGWRRTLIPTGAVVLVGIALTPLAASQYGNGGKVGWIEEATLVSRVGETAKEFVVGVYGPLEIFSAVLGALLIGVALLIVLKRSQEQERSVARDAAIVAIAGVAIPLLPAAVHAIDVFDGRNVLAAWVPFAVLVAIGVGGAKAGKTGAAAGIGLCAISLAVIFAINAIPSYQRDDWRGAAHALPTTATTGPRAIVAERYASLPLSIYLPSLHQSSAPVLLAREVDLITLRTRRTGGAPYAPVIDTHAPSGFVLAGVRDAEAFAIVRFTAPRPTRLSASTVRKITGDASAEISVER